MTCMFCFTCNFNELLVQNKFYRGRNSFFHAWVKKLSLMMLRVLESLITFSFIFSSHFVSNYSCLYDLLGCWYPLTQGCLSKKKKNPQTQGLPNCVGFDCDCYPENSEATKERFCCSTAPQSHAHCCSWGNAGGHCVACWDCWEACQI